MLFFSHPQVCVSQPLLLKHTRIFVLRKLRKNCLNLPSSWPDIFRDLIHAFLHKMDYSNILLADPSEVGVGKLQAKCCCQTLDAYKVPRAWFCQFYIGCLLKTEKSSPEQPMSRGPGLRTGRHKDKIGHNALSCLPIFPFRHVLQPTAERAGHAVMGKSCCYLHQWQNLAKGNSSFGGVESDACLSCAGNSLVVIQNYMEECENYHLSCNFLITIHIFVVCSALLFSTTFSLNRQC